MAKLRAAVAALLAAGQPFLAVCLGHQALCHQLGIPWPTRTSSSRAPSRRCASTAGPSGSASTTPSWGGWAATLPDGVRVDADPESGDIHHLVGPHYRGIQFHAESILTEHGYDVLHHPPGRPRERSVAAVEPAHRTRSRRGRGRPPRLLHLEPGAPDRRGDRGAATGGAARRGRRPTRCSRHSHVVLSPGPGTPDDRADFAVGREVLLAATRPVLRGVPGHAGTGDGVRRHRDAGDARRTGRSRGSTTTGAASSPGCRRASRLSATTRWLRSTSRRRCEVTATRPTAAWSWGSGTSTCRSRACSSTPSRSSPSTVRRWSRTSWGLRRVTADPAALPRGAAAHPRCFWLDGGGAREWSGRVR